MKKKTICIRNMYFILYIHLLEIKKSLSLALYFVSENQTVKRPFFNQQLVLLNGLKFTSPWSDYDELEY